MKRLLVFVLMVCILITAVACATVSNDTDMAGQGNYGTGDSACSHAWSDATCTTPQTCMNCGETTGRALGHNYKNATCTEPMTCQYYSEMQGTALGHQYVSGCCIRCNESDPDYVALGSVQGTITYKYNNYVGNRGDTGALVLLISKDVKSLPDRLGLGLTSENPDNVYDTEVNGNGTYTFSNIPAGEYYIIVISDNTNENPQNVSGYRSWGIAYSLFSEEGQKNALLTAKVKKIRNGTVTVYDNRTTDFSYDFGLTYI